MKNQTPTKPCPFCGADHITYELDTAVAGKWGYAQCGTCGARAPDVRTGGYPGPDHKWHPEALSEWNNRA